MRLKESIDNILALRDRRVAKRFYELLFERHPELQSAFSSVNMRKQQLMLVMALQIVSYQRLHPNPAMESYLEGLGAVHRARGVNDEDYPKFVSVLLETLEEHHGQDWSEELHAEWTQAMEEGTRMMIAGAAALHSKGDHE